MSDKLILSIALLALGAPAFATERQLGAHSHGVGEVTIAIDGAEVAIEIHAPGADIVGFEHDARSDADRAAIEAALLKLGDPMTVMTVPEAAGCSVVEAKAELDGHDGHSEFHAEYLISCAEPTALAEIGFPYFALFPGARELEVQVAAPGGARAVELTPDASVLDLVGMF